MLEKPLILVQRAPKRIVCVVIGCCLMLGCGGGGPQNTQVSGRVEVEGGIPLSEGKLILIPEDPAPGQKPAGATIGADGSFEAYAATGGSGIPPGKYKVMVSFPSGMTGPHPLRKTFKKYTKLETTPLALDVPAAGLTDVVLLLQDDVEQADAANKTG